MRSGLPFLPAIRRRSVLSRAVARWRAGNYNATLDALVDESGNGLHARLGSIVGADSNDPLRLSYAGKYLYHPGSAGNYPTTPNSAALQITSILDMDACVDTYTGGSFVPLVNRRTGTDAYQLTMQNGASRKPQIDWWDNGGTVRTIVCALAVSFSNGTVGYIRVTLVAATGLVTFYESTNGIDWTQIDQQTFGATSIRAGTSPLSLGFDGSNLYSGKYYRARIYSGLRQSGGTLVADFDASLLTEPYATYTDPQGNVWTLNRSTTGRKLCVVDRDLLLLGTDDYLEVADNALLDFSASDSFTLAVVYRYYGATFAANMALLAKRAGVSTAAGDVGYSLRLQTGARDHLFTLDDATNVVSALVVPASINGATAFVTAVRNRSALQGQARHNSTVGTALADPITATLANAEALRIGRASGAATFYADMEFMGAALFRQPLGVSDLARLKLEMGVTA